MTGIVPSRRYGRWRGSWVDITRDPPPNDETRSTLEYPMKGPFWSFSILSLFTASNRLLLVLPTGDTVGSLSLVGEVSGDVRVLRNTHVSDEPLVSVVHNTTSMEHPMSFTTQLTKRITRKINNTGLTTHLNHFLPPFPVSSNSYQTVDVSPTWCWSIIESFILKRG